MSCCRGAAGVALAAVLLGTVHMPPLASPADQRLREAELSWDRGDYPAALRQYLALLDVPDADRLLASIALQTGEFYRTTELTPDGTRPRFSPDGRYLTYEHGRGTPRRTRISPVDAPLSPVAEVTGYGAAFSPDSTTVAYLPLAGSGHGQGREIVLRSLTHGTERRLGTGTNGLTSILPAADVILFGGIDAEGIEQIHAAIPGQPPRPLTSGAPDKVLHAVDSGGTAAVFTYRTHGTGERAFGIVTVPALTITRVPGFAPALSADGSRVTFVRETGGVFQLLSGATASAPEATVIRAGPEAIDSPVFSPDGQRIAFQMRPRDDWDLHVIGIDGGGGLRVTRDIQHDVSPRFLTTDRLIGLMGEPRHRRSFMYDLQAGTRTRLFHNNTVRTIAPEYQLTASPDGSRLLIVADRDGDTISPARGVYLVDLTSTVTREELRERLTVSLAAEEAMRARGRRMFAPIAAEVRRVLANASIDRLFAYQQALFGFDSKHISSPGNRRAAEYLFATHAGFGYEPEYQWFESEAALGGRTANVLATLRGTTNADLVYVVSSHYDSVAESPGADDNASGTAALLETARLLAGRPQPATIVFASFTGEESGLLGSREFVRRAVAANVQIAGALNNDMIGWANDHRLDNTIRYGSPGIRDLQHAAALQFTRLITYDARYFRGTDAHAYFDAYGEIFGGIGSYPVLGNPHYHEPHDLLATINHHLVTEVAKTTAASVMLLASSPGPVAGVRMQRSAGGAARLSWTANREHDIAGYLLEWDAPGSAGRNQLRVSGPSAEIAAPAGTFVAIRAVNRQGLESWDSARVALD